MQRKVIDVKTNVYGQMLSDFLISCNMCIINDCNYSCNDYASISARGCSVVEYCLVFQDERANFNEFKVITVSEMINIYELVTTSKGNNLPDHYLLSWKTVCDTGVLKEMYCKCRSKFDREVQKAKRATSTVSKCN